MISEFNVTKNNFEVILGTANFSLPYGVAQLNQNLPITNPSEIIRKAIQLGINHLDTATSYQAETLIGELWPNSLDCNITTKLSLQDCTSALTMRTSVEDSLKKLKRNSLSTLLLHNPSVLLDNTNPHVIRVLREFLNEEKVMKVGISAYNEIEIIRAKTLMPELTVFHISENICDRRKYSSTSLTDMANSGNTFYVRSIFLQGLLLMDSNQIPKKLENAKKILINFQNMALEKSFPTLDICTAYAIAIPWSSGVIVGANSAQQLTEIKSSLDRAIPLNIAEWPLLDDWTLDPRNWS